MKIALIYNKESEHTTGIYLEKAIKEAGISYQHFWTQYSSSIPKEFDLYFRIDHGDYKYDIPHDLRPAVFWAIDTHLKKPYKKIRRQATHYDIVFCVHKDGAEKLKKDMKIDTQWIPVACDPDIHARCTLPKRYDIGFVGRNAQKFARGRQLELLKQKYPNSFLGETNFKDMCKIYSQSKIGFNSSILKDINMRVFEILSCGCFLLNNLTKNAGFEDLFVEGKHLVTYRNDKELLRLVQYYLANEEEREAIARSGFEHVRNRHTYFHRAQTMFNYMAFKFGGKFNELRI